MAAGLDIPQCMRSIPGSGWRAGPQVRKQVDLGSVPPTEWDAIAACGFDAVWLMGVWQRSPAGSPSPTEIPACCRIFAARLPDFRHLGQRGIPVLRSEYVVDQHLGGTKGAGDRPPASSLKRGMKLLLDFVPNHVAPDHPWVSRASGVLHPGQRRGGAKTRRVPTLRCTEISGLRPRSILPAVARRGAVERFQPGLRTGGGRDAPHDCRAV